MSIHQAIRDLQENLEEMQSIGQLRSYLLQKSLRLVVTIYSTGFSSWDWNITERQVSGVLNWGIRIKISNLSNVRLFLENSVLVPICLDEAKGIDQKDLFKNLKEGIKACIKKAV
ncbi:MAG: hypothetical protein K1060chlam2_01282 [Chlamydiae bacterium]|nr:hypothetical protein [Chlamydiota bacterium]